VIYSGRESIRWCEKRKKEKGDWSEYICAEGATCICSPRVPTRVQSPVCVCACVCVCTVVSRASKKARVAQGEEEETTHSNWFVLSAVGHAHAHTRTHAAARDPGSLRRATREFPSFRARGRVHQRRRAVPCRVTCRDVSCRVVPPYGAAPCRVVSRRAVPCRAVPCRAVPLQRERSAAQNARR